MLNTWDVIERVERGEDEWSERPVAHKVPPNAIETPLVLFIILAQLLGTWQAGGIGRQVGGQR